MYVIITPPIKWMPVHHDNNQQAGVLSDSSTPLENGPAQARVLRIAMAPFNRRVTVRVYD